MIVGLGPPLGVTCPIAGKRFLTVRPMGIPDWSPLTIFSLASHTQLFNKASSLKFYPLSFPSGTDENKIQYTYIVSVAIFVNFKKLYNLIKKLKLKKIKFY